MGRGDLSLNHPVINAASIFHQGSAVVRQEAEEAAIKFICQLFDECPSQLFLGGPSASIHN